MPSFRLQEQILASPEEVYDFLVSTESAQLVKSQIRKTEMVGEGAVGPGSRFQQVRAYRGHEILSEYEVLEAERPSHFQVKAEKEGIQTLFKYEVKRLGSGTELTLTTQVEADGVRKLIAWLIAVYMQRRDKDLLERIEVAIIKEHS